MRLVVQRVKEASVTVDRKVVGKIGRGLLVFVGIHKNDTPDVIPWLGQKLVNLRLFEDNQGKMNRSVQEVGGGILIVSQFTLYASCLNGRRPDFGQTAKGERAEHLYEEFVEEVRGLYKEVSTGIFGAQMDVALVRNRQRIK